MKLEDFLRLFQDQYADSEEITLTSDMDFRNLDSYDSLTGMAILIMIKDNFNFDISEDVYKSLHSVKEIYDYIQQHSL